MITLFLFGAGASNGSLDSIPYPPPLGCQLFNELQEAGGIARTICDDLADRFQQDFEEGMDMFFDKRNEDVTAFLREMARYFVRFKPGPNNLYKKLISKLSGSKDEFVFSTINYDLLIEIALNQAGFAISYSGLPVRKNNFPVIKMHGSCNFLPDVQPGQIQGVQFKVPKTGGILDAPVRAVRPQEVIQFCRREDSIAPAMAMYGGLKWVPFCGGFVKEQQKYWQHEVYRAQHIFVIGAGVHTRDTHIWEPLAKSTAWLGYVGHEWPEFCRWANDNKRKRVDFVAESFKDAIPAIASYATRA
jgi:hypothetical protein